MSNEILNVKLLGKNYDFPKDVMVYKSEHHSFEELRQELLSFMLKHCLDYQNLPSNVERLVYEKYKAIGSICVKKLISYDIFDATVEELVGSTPENYTIKDCTEASKNDGIKLFYKGLSDSMLEQVNALLEQTTSFMNQAQEAEIARDSKVTGTGFGIITNDIIGFGVWAAMESKAIKQQASAADAEFSNEIDAIIKAGETTSKTRLSQYSKNSWIPNLKNSTDLFIITLFQKYIDILISHEKFNADALNHIDMAKSKSILKNINMTDNKAGILESALLSCPFNPEIYDIALTLGNIGDTIRCAQTFDAIGHIESKYKEKCKNIASNDFYGEKEIIDAISPFIEIISSLDADFSTEELLKVHRTKIKEKVLKYPRFLGNNSNSEFRFYVKSLNIFSSLIEDEISGNELREHIKLKLISDIFSKDDPVLYSDIISQVVEKIFKAIIDYKSKTINAKSIYLSKKKEYENFNQSANSEISEIDSRLNNLGIFSFAKK